MHIAHWTIEILKIWRTITYGCRFIFCRETAVKRQVIIQTAVLSGEWSVIRNTPMAVKKAQAVSSYLSGRKIVFHDDNMLEGATTGKALGAPVYPELFGLSIWPELKTISTRKDNPQILNEKDPDILNFEVFPYWYTVSKAATLSHTTPCYELVIEKGILGIMEEARQKEADHIDDPQKAIFYRSVQIAMQGILDYAANISEHATQKAEEEINPGRIDRIPYPFFIREYMAGDLSVEDALNIAGSLWFKLADNVNLVPQAAERLFAVAVAVPAITFGGVDKQGNDAVNELTYILLKVTELLPIRDPNVNARFHAQQNSMDYRNEVSRVILTTKAIPAFYNGVRNIRTLVNQGETLEHARDYAVIGCVELGRAGRDYSAGSSIFMMMYTILNMALHNGRTTVTGDEPLWKKEKI